MRSFFDYSSYQLGRGAWVLTPESPRHVPEAGCASFVWNQFHLQVHSSSRMNWYLCYLVSKLNDPLCLDVYPFVCWWLFGLLLPAVKVAAWTWECRNICKLDFNCLEYTGLCTGWIAELHSSIFNFSRNVCSVVHSGGTILRSWQQCEWVPSISGFSTAFPIYLCFVLFLDASCLMCVVMSCIFFAILL